MWQKKRRLESEIGRPAPTHRKLIEAVKSVEHGKAAPSPEILCALA